jgi:hypothetical protein
MKKMKMVKTSVILGRLAHILVVSSVILTSISCVAMKTGKTASSQANTQVTTPKPDPRDEETIRASAKHYINGQSIPGVGTAIGDVYILPDGGAFGGKVNCGIRWSSGAQMMFGNTITAKTPIRLVQSGSPATK